MNAKPAESRAVADATLLASADESSDAAFLAQPSRTLEIATAVGALAFSLLALFLARSIFLRMGAGGLDPKWWPTVLSLASIALSVVLLARAWLGPAISRDDLEVSNRAGWIRMIAAVGLTVFYVFGWAKVGYVAPTLIYLVALLWLFDLRRPLPLILFPVVTTAFIYGLFHILLRVPL